MNKIEYKGIDYFRLVAAILVIVIHTSPLLSINETGAFFLNSIVARVAVPFFFMATGFFLYPKTTTRNFSYKRILLKIGKLYALSILVYLPLNIYSGYFSKKIDFFGIIKDLLINGTFYHLWYLPATMLGIGIVVFLRIHCKVHTSFFIVGILYFVGLLGDSYYGFAIHIPQGKEFYNILFGLFEYTRNGLFFVPLYCLLGIYIAERNYQHTFKITIIGFVISLSLLFVEGGLLHYLSEPRHDSMYIMLIPCMYFLFHLLLFWKGSSHKNLRTISLIIYIIHPWCIVIVRGFAKVIKMEQLLINNSMIHFILVTILSVLCAVLISLLLNKKKRPSSMKSRAWAEINLSNLRHNLHQIESILPKGCEVMAVVKADAYGHGAHQVASELQKVGVHTFAVASLSEGISLRKKGVKGSILILGYTYPEEMNKLVKYHLIQTVVDYNYAFTLNQYGKKIKVHFKIDTGMNRLGESFDNIDEILKVVQFKNLIIDGMYTHLSVADSRLMEDVEFTKIQLERFYKVVKELKVLGYCPEKLHIQSSYGVLNYSEIQCSYARMGIALYGVLSNEKDQTKVKIDLKPVLTMKARISSVKEIGPCQSVGYGRNFVSDSPMKLATVSIGYADGIPRNLKHGSVLIKGKKVPIIGVICMDQLTIDITDIHGVKQGDIITIIGQDGEENILAQQVANKAGTITNELFSRLGDRLERVYE